jgi:hypothetical protein
MSTVKRDNVETSRAVARPQRVPLHKQNVFAAESKAGFKRMWVNEQPGRIAAFELAGWTIVSEAGMKTHDGLSQVESQLDSVVRRVVNQDPNAACKTAVLMEIPLELYEEDHHAAQAEIDEKERTFDKLGELKKLGAYGSMTTSYS